MCYVDLAAPHSPGSQPPLRCSCGPQWTGERCETPLNLCEDRCYNGGTCFIPKPGIPVCNCKSGYSGARCQNCAHLVCENGGVCVKDGFKETCKCPAGYKGRHCETHICGKNGTPVLITNGVRCNCLPGFTGERCDQETCDLQCLNGGTCKLIGKQPECQCKDLYIGKTCERDLCQGENPPKLCKTNCNCQNNGTCVLIQGKSFCRCAKAWAGTNCEVSFIISISNLITSS